MLTANEIHQFLKENGIKPSDTVLVHTSMRALGGVVGGIAGKAIRQKLDNDRVDRLFILLLALIIALCLYNTGRFLAA